MAGLRPGWKGFTKAFVGFRACSFVASGYRTCPFRTSDHQACPLADPAPGFVAFVWVKRFQLRPGFLATNDQERGAYVSKRAKALIVVLYAAILIAAGYAGFSGGGGFTKDKEGIDDNLQFVTGGESGTYYAFGTVLANYCTNNEGKTIVALSSNGSQANVQSLQDGDADMAFCQADVQTYAYQGSKLFEQSGAYKDFSVVAALYPEQVQIVTTNPDIKTVADLKGKTVSIGAAGSGVNFNAVDILGSYGIDSETDIKPVYQSFADSTDSLKNGKIDAAFVVAGAPTTSITDLSTAKPVHLVSLDDEHIAKLLKTSPYYQKVTIPADAYGLDSDTTTVAVLSVVIANDNVSDDAVYKFTKSIFDGAQAQPDAHDKYSEVSLETATSVATVPYHPGAAKYFAEQGITVNTKSAE